MAVIQKTMVNVGTVMRVWRTCCGPSPQKAAPISPITTPRGLPERVLNSCHSSSTTPPAAARMPSHPRRCIRAPNHSTPITAEKIGIV